MAAPALEATTVTDKSTVPSESGVNSDVALEVSVPVPGDNDFIGPLTASQMVGQMVTRGELSEKHLAVLRERAISNEFILERGGRTVGGPVGAFELEKGWSSRQRDVKRFPALAYPVHKVGNEIPHTYVLRPDNPRTTISRSGKEKVTKCIPAKL